MRAPRGWDSLRRNTVVLMLGLQLFTVALMRLMNLKPLHATSANRRNNATFVTVAYSVSTRWLSTAFSFGSPHAFLGLELGKTVSRCLTLSLTSISALKVMTLGNKAWRCIMFNRG